MSRHPEVKWAQRTDKIFITILLPDAKNANVKLEPEGKLTFSATAGSLDTPFELNLELYDKVNVEASNINVGLRHILCVVEKAEKGWWKRLLKGEGKTPLYLKVDWDKWVDEDEEDEKVGGDVDFGGMDFSGMGGGMGGLGGLGGGMGNHLCWFFTLRLPYWIRPRDRVALQSVRRALEIHSWRGWRWRWNSHLVRAVA